MFIIKYFKRISKFSLLIFPRHLKKKKIKKNNKQPQHKPHNHPQLIAVVEIVKKEGEAVVRAIAQKERGENLQKRKKNPLLHQNRGEDLAEVNGVEEKRVHLNYHQNHKQNKMQEQFLSQDCLPKLP